MIKDKDSFFEGQSYGEITAYGRCLQILGRLEETPEIYKAKEEIRHLLEES